MDGREEEREEEKLQARVRWTIILVAAAVVVFVLCRTYAVRPIAIYNIQGAAADSTSSPASQTASPFSSVGEKEVLVEKSIDLNTASEEELEKLPGIGPVLAERIISYRRENGGFLDIEELMDVDGIGEKLFQKVQDFITVSND